MTHQNHQTNGASLEDCHTNFFALDDDLDLLAAPLAEDTRMGSEVDEGEELTGPRQILEEEGNGVTEEIGEIEANDEYIWSDDYSTFTGVREDFQEFTGPKIEGTSPSGVFTQLWDHTLMESIAQETNRYAWNNIASAFEHGADLPNSSRVNEWVETSVAELYRLVAVKILMSLCFRGRIDEYWNRGITVMSNFREFMSMNRYVLLMRFLHFSDNSIITSRGSERKLAKLKPVIDYLNQKFKAVYSPRKELSLDESLLLWKGHLSWTQCIRTKAARFGIKSYELCEAVSGYVLNIIIYTGKDTSVERSIMGFTSASAKIVLKLFKDYLGKGYSLLMDNYYNSVKLTRFLKSRRTDVIGTLNRRRVDTPADIRVFNDKRVPRGTLISRHCGDVSVTSWKDVKLVTTVSTYHNADVVEGGGQAFVKPIVIQDYNKFMGGVDSKDQQLSSYPMERKRGIKWYIKVFRNLLNISILNSYIIYKCNIGQRRKLTHRQFRYQLAEELLKQFGTDASPKSNSISNPSARLNKDLDHFPEHCVVTKERTARQDRYKRMRCVRCAAQKKQTRSNIRCSQCKVHLCVGLCWKEFHTLENI